MANQIQPAWDSPVASTMSGDVLGIVPHAPLETALRMMVSARVRHLPVIDGGRCLGVLHESDVLWRLWSHDPGEDGSAALDDAGAVARPDYPAVEADTSVRVAASLMTEHGVDAVLVTRKGRLAGILTATDVLRLLGGSAAP